MLFYSPITSKRDASFRIRGFKPGKSMIYPHVPLVGITGVTPAGLTVELNSFQPRPLTSHLFPFPSMHSKKPECYLDEDTSSHTSPSAELMTHAAPYVLLHRELVQVVSWDKGQRKGTAFLTVKQPNAVQEQWILSFPMLWICYMMLSWSLEPDFGLWWVF